MTESDSDLYAFEALLPGDDRALLLRVREFLKQKVEPIITEHWVRGEFPHDLIPGLAELGIAGLPLSGYGCPGRSMLLDGMVAMELTRTDASIASFLGAHSGLAMRTISECGSEEQKSAGCPRWPGSTQWARSG